MSQNRLALSLLSLSLTLSPLFAAADSNIAAEILSAHNQARTQVGVGPLHWSDDIARSAKRWAIELAERNNCSMRHSTNRKLGENLYWASALLWSNGKREVQNVSPRQVVKSWEDEKADYDYRSNSCRPGKVCGHYTQLVWANTKKVGCAYQICDDKGQIWVCQYGPPGNYVGQRPY